MAEKDKKPGGGERKRKCPHCSKDVPAWAKYCPECGKPENPEWQIEPSIFLAKTKVKILVETYKNGVEEPADFVWHIEGEDPKYDRTASEGDANFKKGTKIVEEDFSTKRRRVSFHIIGGTAKVAELFIPPHAPKVEYPEPNPDKSFLDNLLGKR